VELERHCPADKSRKMAPFYSNEARGITFYDFAVPALQVGYFLLHLLT
jgi:hypothetical protein